MYRHFPIEAPNCGTTTATNGMPWSTSSRVLNINIFEQTRLYFIRLKLDLYYKKHFGEVNNHIRLHLAKVLTKLSSFSLLNGSSFLFSFSSFESPSAPLPPSILFVFIASDCVLFSAT